MSHAILNPNAVRYRVAGMDCAACAAKIAGVVQQVQGTTAVKVSIASQVMTLRVDNTNTSLAAVERAVTDLGYRLTRLNEGETDDKGGTIVSPVTSAYRRALSMVVLLNAGYGVVEMIGGFLSNSQALKADALDFIGDGLISFVGLIAIGWSLLWRARAALLQGVFLGALGLSVLTTTAYRVIALAAPEADWMGGFGAIALAVNLAAAWVLMPYRAGDANMRAVWLFSRNDALGNLAVVIAAGLVAWTGTAWPDLAVAVLIASLFLHSSWSIIRDAHSDRQEAATVRPQP